jgi:predicted RNase H-like HicB family nuclease
MQGTFHVIKDNVVYQLRAEPEGGYTVNIPALPGCISFGETIDQAMEMIEEARLLWIETAIELGQDIPEEFELKTAS